jgi:hypothetical protein
MANHGLWRIRLALALWLFGIFGYFIPAATWNPVSRFDLTRAIVEERTFRIDRFADDTGDRALRDGHWYTDKAPVPALLAVPAYALIHALQSRRGDAPEFVSTGSAEVPARRVTVNKAFGQGLYVCSASTAALAGAVLGVLVFEVLRRRMSTRGAVAGAAATVLGTPVLPYATSFYGHVVAAAFLFGGAFLLRPREEDPSFAASRAVRWAGACLALAAGSEYVVTLPAAVIAIEALARAGTRRSAATVLDLALGAAIPLAVIGGYHTACFGAPWRTGYSFIVNPAFASGQGSGLLGIHLPRLSAFWRMLFGAERGLYWIAPALLVGTAGGVWFLVRTRDRFALAAAMATATLLVLNSGYYMWWGGASAGPRHLVPVIAFMGLGIAAAWTRPGLRWLIAALVVLSVLNMLALASVGLEAPEAGNILVDYAWARLRHGKIAHLSGASNLGIALGVAPAASLGPLLAWLFIGLRVVVQTVDDAESGVPGAQHAA